MNNSSLRRVVVISTCMLVLVPIVALVRDWTLARTPREVIRPKLAATVGAPILPQLRLTQAWWTVAGKSDYQHANSAVLGERLLYYPAIRSGDGRRTAAKSVNDVVQGSGDHTFPAEFLTSAQRAEIWHSLSDQANRTSVAMGLNVGETVPTTMRLLSFADDLRNRVPQIWPYSYALLHSQVLIVDPGSKTIIAIVAQ